MICCALNMILTVILTMFTARLWNTNQDIRWYFRYFTWETEKRKFEKKEQAGSLGKSKEIADEYNTDLSHAFQ